VRVATTTSHIEFPVVDDFVDKRLPKHPLSNDGSGMPSFMNDRYIPSLRSLSNPSQTR
jgi:hypothetical protein